ncbi:heparin lyase I family protein [Bradyrhizobium sp. AZCC 2262]|uniref:heparin lyase I family protein n=1 Tax=Bradyrhizobium sp. AZCC 2262 TaxID=3117022 RepID=UPI002FF0008B
MSYYVENANINGNAPWAITQLDSHTLRFQVRPADVWPDNDSHRSEISGATVFAATATVNVSYQFAVQPGLNDTSNDIAWQILGQFHADDNDPIYNAMSEGSPPFAFHLTGPNGIGQGDYLSIQALYALTGQKTWTPVTPTGDPYNSYLYVSPTPILRGQFYDVHVEASFQNNANGFLEVWINGSQVVDYHGPLGYGGGNYWKEGIYEGWSSNQTITVDYANTVVSAAPGAPLILGNVVNGNQVMLNGTAQANSKVAVYDGSTKLGTVTVASNGSWFYETGALSLGNHTLTATATDGAGKVSAASSAANASIAAFTGPTITAVATSAAAGESVVGNTITFTLTMSSAVNVTGTPTLTLNDGGTATYKSGSGTNALTFTYTVGASDLTVRGLAITGAGLPGGATIQDGSGNAAILTGAAVQFPSVIIDTQAVKTPVFGSPVANSDGTFTFTGTAGANTTVYFSTSYEGGLGSAVVNSAGQWTFTTPTLSYNSWNTLQAYNVNSLGDVSAIGTESGGGFSASVNLPNSPTITGNALVGNTVTLYGMVASGLSISKVTVFDGSTQLGTATINSDNSWTFTTSALTNGVHVFTATATNARGTSGASVPDPINVSSSLADTTTPTVASLVASGTGITAGAGDLGVGKVVTLTLNLSEAVTVAGGTPTLTLNNGGTATYTGGSGSNALTFSYTVGAAQDTADLAVTAVNLGTATVKDGAGNAAYLAGAVTNPAGTLQIDTTAPTVASLVASGTGITAGTGNLNAGKVVTLTLNLSEAVTVAGGTPTLTLNNGGTATYTGGSGSNALTFSYTVGAGQNTADLAATAINLGTATVKDGAGNAADLSGAVTNPSGTLQIDTTAPTVASLVASGTGITAGTGTLSTGNVVTLTLNLSEAVTVAGGTPTLTLNNGGTASYSGGSGSNALTFSYTVGAGQNTADLAVTAINLGTATVKDGAGNAANLAGAVANPAGTLQIDTTVPTVASLVASGTGITAGAGDLGTGSVVTLTVNFNEAVTVAGGTPTLTLNNGGTATYTGGSGSSALTFSYAVGAGQDSADLAVTAVNLGTATVKDSSGNAANLTGAVTNPSGTLQIDTTAPTVASLVASGTGITAGSGDLGVGKVVTLTLNLSEAVTVAGGTPTLTLNNGGTATYTGGSGSNALTFSYTVGAGQNTADLAVTAINLGTATVKDGAGNVANLTGAVTNPSGALQIDTTAPSVTQAVASPGSGLELPGDTVTLTLTFGEAVTVTGTPTLALNTGGTATYTGGSGTNALTFSYTVGSNDTTVPALSITQANLPNGATIKDGAGNAANLSGALTTFPNLAIDPPTVVNSITESPATGDLNAGNTVTLTLTFSNAVTVAGGTPTLTLNDGGIATYTGGSGTNALTFSYTVGAGQNTASLAATAVNLNGATVQDAVGNAASVSLSGLAQTGPQIDTTTPTVASLVASGTGITAGAGDLGVGKVVTLTLNLSEAVTVAGGTPTLTLNNGGTATYTGGSGSNALTFSYTVGAGQNTADLAATAINLGTATVKDGAGNAADLSGAVTNPAGTLQIDTAIPTVASLVASGTGITAGAGSLGVGKVVTLTLNLSEAVTVAGGTPTLTLNNGGTATYTGGSGSNALTFSYTVGAGQNTADLAVTAINLGTATVKDGAGNVANLTGAVTNPSGTLQIDTTTPTVSSLVASGTGITAGAGNLSTGSVVTLTLNLSEAVTVAGGTPTLTLNNGGTATYTGGSGSNALTFSYTVGAGQNTADLTVTAINLGAATIKDGAGNAASLTGAVTNPSGTLQIDTTAPTVASLVASGTGITAGAGDLGVGKVVTLTLNLSEAVTVVGGTPTLTLNNGGTATYTGGSGSNALTFSYTVGAGQNTADLAVAAINQGTATIQDGAGNAANLTGAVTNPSGTLQIDTTVPTVASVVASGQGITAGGGNVGTGSVVTLTVSLSEAVTVAGGTPTLTLNDGGIATYTGGSGSSALTFSYKVGAGQNTADLAVTAINQGTATVTDGAGNAANLTGAVTNPAGTLQVDTSAHLTHVGNKHFLANSAGVGPAISSGGVAVTDSQMGGWTFIAAVQVGGGYQVALNLPGADQYTVWNTDSNGNVISSALGGVVSGSSYALESIETTFNQDLNGDGTIGLVTTRVESSGATALDQVANYYLLNPVGGGTGPQLKSGGSVITADQLGGWTVIGAEKTASGYEVALKATSGNQYIVWNTDNNGNVISSALGGAVSGSSYALESIETTFNQDLNGDGTIGFVTTRVESSGATALDQVANYFLLNPVGGGTGPQLKSGGSVITVDQLGGWTVIGAEKTASGYEVALKATSGNQYIVWNTDNNGNVISSALGGVVSGSSSALQGIEASFQQDLNGDGTIGFVTTRVESLGATALDQVANYYLLNPVGGGTGPQLKSGGSVITVDQLGGWTVIGAEKTASGYEVALKATSGNQYIVWNTDNNGNVISNAVGGVVSGSSSALQGIEASFQQDLNGDGTIGFVTTRVESLGATALDQVANYYLLNPVGGGTGPQLKSGGSVITVDQLGGWTLIGAEKTASGYEVALKAASGNQYTVWNTDNNGNVISNAVGGAVSGSSAALQGIEASFHQDLNGDGVILLSGSGSIIGANSLVIGSGASAELTGAYSGSVSFAGATGTLVIDNSANFHGTIGGQLTTTDVIDLADITAGANATIGYTGNNSPGTLTVSDGTKTASIALLGNYSLANFTVASDGHGGTTVVDPPLPGQQESLMSENSGSDPAPSLAALDQRLALWSQHMASAFASSGWDSARTSTFGAGEFGGISLPQLAQPVTQQHAGITG